MPGKPAFHEDPPIILKAKKLISKLSLWPWTNSSSALSKSAVDKPLSKKQKLAIGSNCSSELRLHHEGYVLTKVNRNELMSEARLTDRHIRFSQLIFKIQFLSVDGLQLTLLVTKKPTPVASKSSYLQRVHCRNNHWITASSTGCTQKSNSLLVCNSLYSSTDNVTMNLLHLILRDDVCVRMAACPCRNLT